MGLTDFRIILNVILSSVIGVLEANFVEPAHDKQGFERTTVLARLEAKLVQMQKTYWFVLVICFRCFLMVPHLHAV